MTKITQLLEALEQGSVPFSFHVNGQPAVFEYSHQRERWAEPRRRDYVFSVKDCPITVVMEIDHAAERDLLTYSARLIAEKTVEHRVSNVRICDLTGLDATTLRGWEGGNSHETDEEGKKYRRLTIPPLLFKMWDKPLEPEPLFWENLDGRSSCELLPIWFLYNNEGGLWFAPEWMGTWSFGAGREEDAGAHAWCALPILDFTMQQGEEVQLPPVSLGTFSGPVNDGCVKLRRIIRDEFLPTIGGKKPLPPVACHAIGGSLPQFDAEGLRLEMDVCSSMGIEQFNFASCWYRPPKGSATPFEEKVLLEEMFPHCKDKAAYEIIAWWEKCGDFDPDPQRFPEGMKACAEQFEARDMILGLWYDPRINVMTESHNHWKDALTPYNWQEPNDDAWNLGLIDMGRESGRQLMFELLDKFVEEYGVKYLWHDMNVPPRFRYWKENEQEGRKGLMELRHYVGAFEVYDRFREKHPDVWLEWCGSGGTMVNLGIMRRAHTLHIADFCGIHDAEQPNADPWRDMRTSLNWIFPSTYINNHLGPPKGIYEKSAGMGLDIYLTSFGSALNLHQTVSRWSDRDRADATTAIGVFKNIRKYTLGDFWSLFPQHQDQDGWDGWQFHDPQTGTGILLFFKRRDCREDQQTVTLRWPEDPARLRYASILGDAKIKANEDGSLNVTMPDKAAVLRYDRCDFAGTEMREFPDE